MEKYVVLTIILGAILIALSVGEYILDRFIVSRRKKFATEIEEDVQGIAIKISEIEKQIEIGESNLVNMPEEQRRKFAAEFGRLKINLNNQKKCCERILRKAVEMREMAHGA